MQSFDEMCMTTHHDNSFQAKFPNHGTPGIQVGFTEGYSVGTYCVFNLKKLI